MRLSLRAASLAAALLAAGTPFARAAWGPDTSLASAEITLMGMTPGEEAGHALAGVGDVNGDGLGDLLIGAWSNDEVGEDAGKAYLVLGRRDPAQGTISLADADASFIGEAAGDFAGFAVSDAGDVNGDGLDDLLIGAQGSDASGENSGAAYLILGRREADWGRDFPLANADVRIVGTEGSFASFSMGGGGDLNGDGLDDFSISAPRNEFGTVHVIIGRREGWPRQMSVTSADVTIQRPGPGHGGGYGVGGDVPAMGGDVNGDGVGDLFIGAWQANPVSPEQGFAHLILGHRGAWPALMSFASAEATFCGEFGRDQLGETVAFVGDVNGDQRDDVVAASARNHGLEPGDPSWGGCGQSYLILQQREEWRAGVSVDQAAASFVGEQPGDVSGSSVSGVGDVDGDGLDDFLIGAPTNDQAERDAGKVYLIRGRSEGWALRSPLSEADASFLGVGRTDRAGYSTTGLGDFDGNGLADFAIGARYGDLGGHNAGQVHLLLSRP